MAVNPQEAHGIESADHSGGHLLKAVGCYSPRERVDPSHGLLNQSSFDVPPHPQCIEIEERRKNTLWRRTNLIFDVNVSHGAVQ